jgi:hypothetical protein
VMTSDTMMTHSTVMTHNSENGGHVYLAINDILSHYDTKKKAANAVKTAKHGSCGDCCDPYNDYKSYARSYESFIHKLVKDTSDLSLVVKNFSIVSIKHPSKNKI